MPAVGRTHFLLNPSKINGFSDFIVHFFRNGAKMGQIIFFISLNLKMDSANSNISKKQDASTAITTSNIGKQSVNYANSAGSANSAAIANKTTATYNGNPSPICPSLSNSQVQFLWNTSVMRVDVYVDKTYIGHIVTN